MIGAGINLNFDMRPTAHCAIKKDFERHGRRPNIFGTQRSHAACHTQAHPLVLVGVGLCDRRQPNWNTHVPLRGSRQSADARRRSGRVGDRSNAGQRKGA